MKKAGNCLIYIAILFILDLLIMDSIWNIDYNSPKDLSTIKQGYQALKIIGFIQIILLFVAGLSLKNDNTIIRKMS